MSEKHSLLNVNRAAIAGGAFALACVIAANKSSEQQRSEPYDRKPDTTYAVTKDCAKDPKAYQAFTLEGIQRIFVTAGLRAGQLENKDAVVISGTAQEINVTPYDQEGRTVFPDKLTPNVVEAFPFPVLGTVAIGHLHGNADPSVILACDIQALTEQGQPLEGQVIDTMPPIQ